MNEYLSQITNIPATQIAYVDETGIDTCLYREHAYSAKGVPIYGIISGRKYKRIGVVAAQMGKKILSPLQYEGTMDSGLFEMWFEKCLLPTLPKHSAIVMGNAAFHRKSRLFHLAKESGHRLIFLPPYSPELNPLKIFAVGSSDISEKFSPTSTHLTSLSLSAFKCVGYILGLSF